MTRSHEDALRDALRSEADGIRPAGSFGDVRARQRQLDRRAAVLRAAAVLVVVLGMAAIVQLVDGRGDGESQEVDIVDGSTQTTDTTAAPVPADDVLGIWPFATGKEADAAENVDDAPEVVAAAFLRAVGGDGFELVESMTLADDEALVVFTNPPAPQLTEVELARLGSTRRWTVVGASSDGLELDAPKPGKTVRSPVTISGRATAFEGTVQLQVISGAGTPPETLGERSATGEQGELRPFTGELSFRLTPSGVGAVVAFTSSAEDGATEQVAAVAIRWEPGADTDGESGGDPLDDDEMIAVVTRPRAGDPDEHEVVVLGADGEERRTLYGAGTAEGGIFGVALTPDRRRLLVTVATSACESRMVALRVDGRGSAVPLGDGEALAVSPDGERVAVAVDGDCDGHDAIEIRGLRGDVQATFGEGARSTAGLPDTIEEGYIVRVRAIVWADEETLVYEVQYEDGIALFVLDIDGDGRDERLRPEDPDRLWHAPARDAGGRLTVVESTFDDDLVAQAERIVMLEIEGLVTTEVAVLAGEVISHLWRGDTLLWLAADWRLLRRSGDSTQVIGERIAHATA